MPCRSPCMSSDGRRVFTFMNNEPLNRGKADGNCNSTGKLLTHNLSADDYRSLNECCDSRENYRSGLAWANNNCRSNETAPYSWSARPYRSTCVDGSPLNIQLPTNRTGCWSATITFGGDNNNSFHSNWTRCSASLPYICQKENLVQNTTLQAVNVPTISTISSATPKTSAAPKNSLLTPSQPTSSNAAAIVGAILGILFILVLVILFLIFRRSQKYATVKNGIRKRRERLFAHFSKSVKPNENNFGNQPKKNSYYK